jgi:NAD(P)-dependent dehydrogenase (short-subunit alcohol dehydrogenase family)
MTRMDAELFALKDRVALITEGFGGLGLTMARALQHAGAQVSVGDLSPEKKAVATDSSGAQAVLDLDVRDEGAVAQTLDEVVKGGAVSTSS